MGENVRTPGCFVTILIGTFSPILPMKSDVLKIIYLCFWYYVSLYLGWKVFIQKSLQDI